MFGPHLTLDLYGCNAEKLNDRDFIYKFLDRMPSMIGMNKFSEPHLQVVPPRPNSFDKGGISGFVLLVESHITIHTFPADNFVSLDIFSCKEFDLNQATEYAMKGLGAKKAEKNFLTRGREFVKHYPKSVKKAKTLVIGERTNAV